MMSSLKPLIAELEAAKEGSRELDVTVSDALGTMPKWYYEARKAGRDVSAEGYFRGDSRGWPPRYTTSLDAKLPGEDIIQTAEQMTGNWMALQRRGKNKSKPWEAAYGKTEILARRIAALKARDEA